MIILLEKCRRKCRRKWSPTFSVTMVITSLCLLQKWVAYNDTNNNIYNEV